MQLDSDQTVSGKPGAIQPSPARHFGIGNAGFVERNIAAVCRPPPPRTRHQNRCRIIDFVDSGHPALLRMWDKRQRGYRAMGYRMTEERGKN